MSLPAEDADVQAIRNGMGVSDLRRRAALDRLTKRVQEAERERDELRAWKTATHEQWAAWTRDDFKARAEAAEAREAALAEKYQEHAREWDSREAALREALERLLYNAELIFSKKPVRDWGETLAEARDALATADPGATE